MSVLTTFNYISLVNFDVQGFMKLFVDISTLQMYIIIYYKIASKVNVEPLRCPTKAVHKVVDKLHMIITSSYNIFYKVISHQVKT